MWFLEVISEGIRVLSVMKSVCTTWKPESAMHIYHKGTGHKVQMMFVASYVSTSHTQHAAMCEEIGFVFRCVCGCVYWEGQNKYHIDLYDHDCS